MVDGAWDSGVGICGVRFYYGAGSRLRSCKVKERGKEEEICIAALTECLLLET
jgi:hypothetical protein